MAIGKCQDDVDIDQDRVVIRFGDRELYPTAVDDAGLAELSRYLAGDEVRIHVSLGIGDADVHRVGLRPHRRLRPPQRRLHHLTRPARPAHLGADVPNAARWARWFSISGRSAPRWETRRRHSASGASSHPGQMWTFCACGSSPTTTMG